MKEGDAIVNRWGLVSLVLLLAIVNAGCSGLASQTNDSAPAAPSITTQPASQTVTPGLTANFTVAATGTAPLSYQWRKNGTPISGATSSSYTTPATTTSDNGAQFTAVISNALGSVISDNATLTVNTAPVGPSITTQPANQTVTAGQTATFTVSATGTAPLAYQWRKNGAAISGATSSSYTTPATTSSDNGAQFTVVVSNAVGSVTSNAATLSVNPLPVQITTTSLPGGQVQTAYSATLAATGGLAPYTWSLFSGLLPTGLTLQANGTLSGTPTLAGTFPFIVQVRDAAGQTASATFSLNIAALPPPANILWSGDMETGDLSQWYFPSTSPFGNYLGGEFNSGGGDSVASQDFAHTGQWSAKMTINTSAGSSGTRLFRWGEPRTYDDLYYSNWFYFPQKFTYSQWSNYVQWKSKHVVNGVTATDPILYLVATNRSNGNMHFVVHWWNGLTIEGPHPGEFGFRVYEQNLKDIPVGQWFHIEARYVCAADFTGRLTVWQDGVQLFDLTGIRTRYADGDCQWSVNDYGAGITPNPAVIYVDDAVISTGRVSTNLAP